MAEFGLTKDEALVVSDHMPVWAVFSAVEGDGAFVATYSMSEHGGWQAEVLRRRVPILYAANRSDVDAATKAAIPKRLGWAAKKPDVPTLWEGKIGLLARGMVLCEDLLFVAGPPDLFSTANGDNPHPYTPAAAESLREQREALAGKHGTLLWAVSAKDGKKLSETKLDGLPTWDGLIAARGRLYLTMQDGTVTCFSGKASSGPTQSRPTNSVVPVNPCK